MSSNTIMHRGTRAAPRRRSRTAALFGAALLVLGTTACEGDNLFGGNSGGTGGGAPVVARIMVADTVYTGEPIDLGVKAIAPAGMATITVRYRRALNADPGPVLQPARTDTVTYIVSPPLHLPPAVPDNVLIIEAWATDKEGRVSEIVSRLVHVASRSGA